MKKAEILSHAISYKDIGKEDAPILILFHGYGGSTSDWSYLADKLALGFRIIIPNLSSLFLDPDRPMSFSQQVIVLKEFIKLFKKNKKEQLFLSGNSYGAALAYALTVEESDAIDKLVLLNPMPPNPQDHVKNPLLKTLLKIANHKSVISLLLYSPLGKLGLPHIQNIFHVSWLQSTVKKNRISTLTSKKIKMISHVFNRFAWIIETEDWAIWRSRMSSIKVPVHIVIGGRDNLFPQDSYTELARAFPNSSVTKIPHGAHLISKENPEDVLEIFEEFLITTKLSVVSTEAH